MLDQTSSTGERLKDFFERLFALKITSAERLVLVDDPRNIYSEEISGRKPLLVSLLLALVIHFILFIIFLPDWTRSPLVQDEIIILKNLARPARLIGGAPPEDTPNLPKPKPTVPKPKPVIVPIPDPTPNAPEPIRKELDEIPKVIEEFDEELNIGDVTAPPGPPSQSGQGRSRFGEGTGPAEGSGSGAGDGSGQIFELGSGINDPQLIKKSDPQYTDEAIKAKVQGTIVLTGIIRKNGQVDSLRIIRGLGYGLDEQAIKEIATNWLFRPGTLNGQAVDVRATIEVNFTLR